MNITESEALSVVSLAAARSELRIPDDSHDALLKSQIISAVSFVSQSTGLALADLPAAKPAIVSAVRDMYNGVQQIGPNAAAYGWMTPYRSFKPPE